MEIRMIKKRRNFDDVYDDKRKEIDKIPSGKIKEYREGLKFWLSNIDELSREDDITNGWKMYLRGLRKVAINLLKYSKDRMKTMNAVLYNGTTVSHAMRFIRIACEILPQETFQQIYGLSLSQEEKEKMTLESVREFMDQSEIIATHEVDGNIIK